MNHNFNYLSGAHVFLKNIDESCITSEYLDRLNDLEIVRFSNQRFTHHTKEAALQYISSFLNTNNLFLGIFSKENNTMVGTINTFMDSNHGLANIGIMIGELSQWSKGLGRDAWQALMNYLFLDYHLRKITGGTIRPNVGMVRVMERSGMHLEAERTKQQVVDGEAHDVL